MIDTLVTIIADQNGGKSNQIRSIFDEFELKHYYGGYPTSPNIAKKYFVHPDIDLLVRLSSWHEKNQTYDDVKKDISNGVGQPNHRYKILMPAQVSATSKLMSGEEMFIQLHSDFEIRRSFAIWLSPDRLSRTPFNVTPQMATFLSTRRNVSALAIDSLAAHPSAAPSTNSVNARLICDLLFRT